MLSHGVGFSYTAKSFTYRIRFGTVTTVLVGFIYVSFISSGFLFSYVCLYFWLFIYLIIYLLFFMTLVLHIFQTVIFIPAIHNDNQLHLVMYDRLVIL